MLFFDEAIESQDGLRTSLIDRASRIPAVSGSLVGLVVAVSVLARGGATVNMSRPSIVILMCGLACLVGSTITAVVVQRPGKYRRVEVETLHTLADDPNYWKASDESIALRRIAQVKADYVSSAVDNNQRDANVLTAAYLLQVGGIALLVVALGLWILA